MQHRINGMQHLKILFWIPIYVNDILLMATNDTKSKAANIKLFILMKERFPYFSSIPTQLAIFIPVLLKSWNILLWSFLFSDYHAICAYIFTNVKNKRGGVIYRFYFHYWWNLLRCQRFHLGNYFYFIIRASNRKLLKSTPHETKTIKRIVFEIEK